LIGFQSTQSPQIHQINAPSSFVTISQSFVAKRGMGLCKNYLKRERERKKEKMYRKNGQVSKRKIDE
jgi:hypothetical protein